VAGNAGTYLADKVAATTITNQRLWGAMGLATASRWHREPAWSAAVHGAVARAVDEQRPDGSWGYEPGAAGRGGHPGAADLTVYYHSRCLAFLWHILDCLPELDGPRLGDALHRGLDFLAAVITPDGRKPLALEGKRWFWAGEAEAGSNAFDVYALLRGATRFGVPEWRDLAARSWARLVRHQARDGSVVAGAGRGVPDFVCPTFHTADTAWTAQVLADLPGRDGRDGRDGEGTGRAISGVRARAFPQAGVLRLESDRRVALLRTAKGPRNTQWGGAIGGGTLVYAGDTSGGDDRLRPEREAPETVASYTLYPRRPSGRVALLRFRRSDPPGREGRQWLFVARLLLAQGRPIAASARLWQGYLYPFRWSLADPAGTHWATRAAVEVLPGGRVRVSGQPARPGGDVPAWAAGVSLTREISLEGDLVRVSDRLAREVVDPASGKSGIGRVIYVLPEVAGDVSLAASDAVRRDGPKGRRVELRPGGSTFFLRVAYSL
jgi:hypothetical protein